MNSLFRFVSYVFHPVFVVTYLSCFIMWSNPYHFSNLSGKHFWVSMILIVGLTALYPLFAMVIMLWLKLVKSIKMQDARERFIPLIVITTFYLWTYFMIRPGGKTMLSNHELLADMVLGSVVSLFIVLATFSFQKVSLHMIGAGAMVGCVLNIIPISPYNLLLALLGTIVLAGLIGTARLALKAHNAQEVVWGFFIGFLGQFFAYQIWGSL